MSTGKAIALTRQTFVGKVTSLILNMLLSSVPFSSVAQSCPTPCTPMDRRTPGLPVHHQLSEFTQTHVHRVSDAIQPSHPLSSPSPPAPNHSQLSRLVITFLPRSNYVLISWLQSPSVVILEPPKIQSDTVSSVSTSICQEVMGPDAMIFVF